MKPCYYLGPIPNPAKPPNYRTSSVNGILRPFPSPLSRLVLPLSTQSSVLSPFLQAWVEQALIGAEQVRESKWTESIAVGSRDFVDVIKRGPGVRAKERRISGMWMTNLRSTSPRPA